MKFPPPSPRSMVHYETGPMPSPERVVPVRNDRLEQRKQFLLGAFSNHIREEIQRYGLTGQPNLLQDVGFKNAISTLIWEWVPKDSEEIEEILRFHWDDLRTAFLSLGYAEPGASLVFDLKIKRQAIFHYFFDQILQWYKGKESSFFSMKGSKPDGDNGQAVKPDQNAPRPRTIRVVPR